MDSLDRLSEILDFGTIDILRVCIVTSRLDNERKRELFSKLEEAGKILEVEEEWE